MNINEHYHLTVQERAVIIIALNQRANRLQDSSIPEVTRAKQLRAIRKLIAKLETIKVNEDD